MIDGNDDFCLWIEVIIFSELFTVDKAGFLYK